MFEEFKESHDIQLVSFALEVNVLIQVKRAFTADFLALSLNGFQTSVNTLP